MNLTNISIVVGVASLIALSVFVVVKQRQQWEEHKAQYNCRIVEKRSGFYTYDSKGKSIHHPSQTAWKCDDGVTYWK